MNRRSRQPGGRTAQHVDSAPVESVCHIASKEYAGWQVAQQRRERIDLLPMLAGEPGFVELETVEHDPQRPDPAAPRRSPAAALALRHRSGRGATGPAQGSPPPPAPTSVPPRPLHEAQLSPLAAQAGRFADGRAPGSRSRCSIYGGAAMPVRRRAREPECARETGRSETLARLAAAACILPPPAVIWEPPASSSRSSPGSCRQAHAGFNSIVPFCVTS